MANTPIFAVPEWAAAQATPWLTENQTKRLFEALIRASVEDRDLAAPPGTCADGAAFLVDAAATGAWAGHDGELAVAVGTNAASGWLFAAVETEGAKLWVIDESVEIFWDGAAWVSLGLALDAASTTEQLTGTSALKASTPDSVAALWEQGSDVASAGTISLGEGGYFSITGTTTITDIDFATDKAGRKAWVKFAGVLTLTHHATTLVLPTGADITTAAGDTACFVSEGSDAVRCVAYQRASGAALSGTSYTDADAQAAIHAAPSTQAGTSYTAVLGDAYGYIRFTSGSAVTFTIPPNSSVAFPVGTTITVEQADAGVVTLDPDTGVTLNSRGGLLDTAGQFAVAQVKKVATDTWTVIGDVA